MPCISGPVGPAASIDYEPDGQFAGLAHAGPLYFQAWFQVIIVMLASN